MATLGLKIIPNRITSLMCSTEFLFIKCVSFFSLGVRCCGSLWFDPQSGKYERQDKYKGRKYNAQDFEDALCRFVSDGVTLRTDVVRKLISQLRGLQKAISSLDSYRFYGR